MSASKKVKVASGSQYLDSKVLSENFQQDLANKVKGSEPYEHGVIDGLLDDDLLRTARKEIFDNIQFTEKETDIYKLNQTGDLLNLDGLPENEIKLLGSLLKVRDALYSKEFRDVMSRVTRCGPLSGTRFDLSLNNYNKGCHLLAHDDVIGTRVVSFILYLVPPDYEWNPKWGGALQLYHTVKDGVPETDPAVRVPPKWNQLSFFKIIPGRSFHDVQEVYVDQPRLSIQGWFHAPQEGEPEYDGARATENSDAQKSTLAQLSKAHTSNEGYEPERVFKTVKATKESELNREYLSKFVSMSILDDLKSLREQFVESSILSLKDFLAPEFWARVKNDIEQIELERVPKTSKEVKSPWAVAKPPHLHRYMYLQDGENGASFQELKSLFASDQFAKFLESLTGITLASQYVEMRRFRPGLDYTMASVSGASRDILETVLSLTPAKWDDKVGGYDLIMNGGHDENDDPAIYRAASEDEDDVLLSKEPVKNELLIVLRDPDLLRFVKYVSKNAAGSRWDLLGEYEIEEDEIED